MKIRKAIGLAVLLLITSEGVIAQSSKAKSLNSVIQELAPIARLTNGIALQTELSKDPKKVDDVVAEFLGVQSGDQLVKLKTMEVEGVAKSLKEFYEVVENVPQMNVDMQALKQSFEALEEMKKNVDVLKKTVTNPSAQLQSDVDQVKMSGNDFYDTKGFQVLANELEFVQKNQVFDVVNVGQVHIDPLKAAATRVLGQLNNFEDYENGLKKLFKVENISTRLDEVEKIAKLSQHLTENFATFSVMSQKLTSLKTSIPGLKAMNEKTSGNAGLVDSLKTISNTTLTLGQTPSTPKLTAGFPKKNADLQLLLNELKTDLHKKLVSQGKDTKELQTSLASLHKFSEQLGKLDAVWKQFTGSPNPTAPKEVTGLLSRSATDSQKNPNFSQLETSLDSVKDCFNTLALPTQAPDFEKVKNLFTFAKNLSQQVETFKNFFASKKSAFIELKNPVTSLVTKLQNLDGSSRPTTIQPVWDDIKNATGTNDLITAMKRIVADFAPLQQGNPFTTARTVVDWTVIPTLLDNVKGTNMETMLDCTKQASYNPNDIASALSFGSSLQMMKTKKQEFNSTQAYLAELAKVKSGLLDVAKTITNFKKTRRSRRRRATNPKSLTNLRNAPDVSASLGKGVQVLREYCKILEAQESVMVAVNAVDPLKSAVDGIQGAQSVWNDKNRKDMGVMVTDLNKLETFAGSMKKDNISELWKIFGEAGKVPDFTVDAKIFADPISVELANNADPQVKPKSADFQNIGGLNLDFARHRVDLFAASQALQPLQQFFDDFFDNNKNVGGAQAQSSNAQQAGPSIGLIAGAVAGVLCVAGGGVGGWFGWKYYKKSQRWKNRERHWHYTWAIKDSDDSEFTMINAIMEKRVGVLKRMIKDGFYIDTCQHFTSKDVNMYAFPLHVAVCYALPKAVELLIRGGADRSLWNSLNLTAEQQLDKCLVDERYKDERDALKEIKAIFQKYAKKTFRPRVREMMPIDRFSVKIFASDEHKKIAEAFAAKYPDIHRGEEWELSDCTHRVFPTDADGILDLDKLKPVLQTDKLNLQRMLYMLSKLICTKISWLDECLKSEKNFHKDYDYRITKFRYNGKVYETADEWRKWKRNRAIPCLYNVAVAYYEPNEDKLDGIYFFEKAVTTLKAEYLSLEDLVTGSSTRNTAPYWFPKMNRHWIVHQKGNAPDLSKVLKECDAADLKTDFVVMSIEEFFEHLFKLNGWKDLKPEPVIDVNPPKPAAPSVQGSAQGTTQESTNKETKEATKESTTTDATGNKSPNQDTLKKMLQEEAAGK